jgi:hypothetical protein
MYYSELLRFGHNHHNSRRRIVTMRVCEDERKVIRVAGRDP